ncbi:MAG: chalcone isomerase family protein [Planctomycetes bacterium]|nr:chalcone isomerase family protein [Planctomycetota bacterium]
MSRPQIPLLALALLALAPSIAAQDPVSPAPTVEEPRSEVQFAKWMTFPGSKASLHLLDVGVRTKTILAIKVYAFGLYLEAKPAAKALEAYKGLSQKERRKSGKLYQALLDGEFSKGLRWVMTRDVDGEDIAEAFADSLEPRLKKLAKSAKPAEVEAAKAALTTFKAYFKDELTEDTELIFAWHPGGRLVTMVNGKVLGEVKSQHLALALFDVYLGADPISDDAKEAFADSVPAFVEMAAKLPEPKAQMDGSR